MIFCPYPHFLLSSPRPLHLFCYPFCSSHKVFSNFFNVLFLPCSPFLTSFFSFCSSLKALSFPSYSWLKTRPLLWLFLFVLTSEALFSPCCFFVLVLMPFLAMFSFCLILKPFCALLLLVLALKPFPCLVPLVLPSFSRLHLHRPLPFRPRVGLSSPPLLFLPYLPLCLLVLLKPLSHLALHHLVLLHIIPLQHSPFLISSDLECGLPAPIRHGSYSLINGTRYYLSQVKYECEPGYTAIGRSELVCDIDERWNGPPPLCHRK